MVEVVKLVRQISEFTGRAVDVDEAGSKGREESFLPTSRDLREVEVAGTTEVIVAHFVPGRERRKGRREREAGTGRSKGWKREGHAEESERSKGGRERGTEEEEGRGGDLREGRVIEKYLISN